MIKKFESVADLLKVGGLASHFKKAASHHTAKASAHQAMAEAHTNYATAVKAKHDGMDDADAQKGFMKAHGEFHVAKAAHHSTMHALHKAHADHLHELSDNVGVDEKAASAKCAHDVEMTKACDKCNRKAATAVADGDLGSLLKGSLQEIFSEMQKSDDFKTMLRNYVMGEARKSLGLEMEPTKVFGTVPTNPNITLVKRPGGFDPDSDKEAAEIDAANPVAAEIFGS